MVLSRRSQTENAAPGTNIRRFTSAGGRRWTSDISIPFGIPSSFMTMRFLNRGKARHQIRCGGLSACCCKPRRLPIQVESGNFGALSEFDSGGQFVQSTFLAEYSEEIFKGGIVSTLFTPVTFARTLFGGYIQDDWRWKTQPDPEIWVCATRWRPYRRKSMASFPI